MVPSTTPGFSSAATDGMQAATISSVRSEELRHVYPHDRGRHESEVGERRVAPADVGPAGEDMSEPVHLGGLLQLRPWIRDRDEPARRLRAAEPLGGALEEVLLEDVRLECGTRLARDDEQRRPESIRCSNVRTCAGSVESSTCSSGNPVSRPKVIFSTSGPRLDPPMPRSRTCETPSLRATSRIPSNRCRCAS